MSMWLHVDVVTCRCGNMSMWLHVDVVTCRCGYMSMWLHVDVVGSISGATKVLAFTTFLKSML